MIPVDRADLFLSVAALIGLIALAAVLRGRDAEDPLNRRFLFGLQVASVIFAGRAALTLTGWSAFGLVIRLAAALVPIAVLIITEGLLRRHAPRWAKLVAGGGTVLGLMAALWPARPGVDPEDLVLMVVQVAGFATAGWLVIRRDRASLAAAENRAALRLALSLLLLLPLAMADFLGPWLGLQIRPGGLSVLVLCWLALSLGRVETEGAALRAALVVLALAVLTAIALPSAGDGVTLPMVLAALLVLAVIREAIDAGAEERQLSLLRHLAEAPSSQEEFLRGLLARSNVEGAVIIEGAALTDLDPAVIRRGFGPDLVLRRGAGLPGSDEGDALAHLFDSYAATHLLRLGDAPLRLVALSMPALAASSRAELEMAAAVRMARALGATGGHGNGDAG